MLIRTRNFKQNACRTNRMSQKTPPLKTIVVFRRILVVLRDARMHGMVSVPLVATNARSQEALYEKRILKTLSLSHD